MLEKLFSNYPLDSASPDADKLNLPDEKLWESLVEGSEIAFDEIYRRYFDKLYVYSRHLTQDTDLIKDAIQEVFVELWKYRQKLSKVKHVKPYLHKSVRRKVLKEIKKVRSAENNESIGEPMQVIYSRERSLINEQTSQRQKELITKAFNSLSDRQKEAVVLKYYNDFSYQEIAETMSLKKVKSARTLLYRAIETLRMSLSQKVIYSTTVAGGAFSWLSIAQDFFALIFFILIY
ncbi:MAG: sigma-70 family RNA polymerase sigma factor [Bacteroidota bacterium]